MRRTIVFKDVEKKNEIAIWILYGELIGLVLDLYHAMSFLAPYFVWKTLKLYDKLHTHILEASTALVEYRRCV